MPKNMRTFIDLLRQKEAIYELKKEVDPLLEVSALVRQAGVEKAIFFHRLAGFPDWRGCGVLARSRRRLALALGVPVDRMLDEYSSRVKQKPTEPQKISDGPVKEIILKGQEADLNLIPTSQISEKDAGPYLAFSETIVRDPDTGLHNMAILRLQVKGKDKLGIYCIRGRHTWSIYEKYKKMGQPMPVAIVTGHHPAFHLAGLWCGSPEVDELALAGSFLGEPLRVVPCETVELLVPADAEMVIEGEILPQELELEGPFSEFTGYYCLADHEPVVHVTAITMRHDAIFEYEDVLGGAPADLGRAQDLYARLKEVEGLMDIKDVNFLSGVGLFTVVIKMTPHYRGQAKNTLLAALSSTLLHPKLVIAVDDDVDIYDPGDVFWALANRVNPEKDVFIVSGTRNHPFDLKLPLCTETLIRQRLGSKMGIDATKPPTSKPEERAKFDRARPLGWQNVKLADFLD
ncbi:MAG: UbiD family decarboxylase [Thermodesulfobacteriota bacterium]